MKWEKKEIELAKSLIKEGLGYLSIAEKLGRTYKSVRLKMNKEGITVFKPKEIIEINCKNCGSKFDASKSSNRKFCSSSCSVSFNNKGISRNLKYKNKNNFCINCRNEIDNNGRYFPNQKYCSRKCQNDYQWKLKKKRIENGEVDSPSALRRYVSERDGVLCKICKGTEWNGKDIPLVLDHINGDPYNNLPENLRMICPNCDAQTEFYKGKNKGRGRDHRMKRYYEGKSY